MKKKIINIDGTIGSGKSTLCGYIQNNFENCFIIKEKVDDEYGNMLLKLYYIDPTKHAFNFDAYLLESKKEQIIETYNKIYKLEECTIIFDRSLSFDINVFSQYRKDKKFLTNDQFDQLIKKRDEIEDKINLLFSDFERINVFLSISTELSMKRIEERNRNGEIIPFEFADDINRLHDMNVLEKSITLNSENNVEKNFKTLLNIVWLAYFSLIIPIITQL